MNIIRSLNDIRSNKDNFRKWEAEQRLDEAKRDALSKSNPPSSQELKSAKDYGKTIIDVVDIMDQHSEDVAENVEMATAGAFGFLPLAALFGTGYLSLKTIFEPAWEKKWKAKELFLKNNNSKIKELIEKIEKEHPELKNKLWERRFLNKEQIEKLKISAELKKEAATIAKEWFKATKDFRRKNVISVAIPVISTIATFIGTNLYGTKLQVDSSKVARFQARKVLEDPKYFVKYTPEQIAEAKRILAEEKEKDPKGKKKLNTDKLKGGFFKGIFNVLKDNKEYKIWKANDTDESKKVDRPLTKEELINAQKDQEVIHRVVRKINNNAENYSERMELASNIIINGTPILGLIGGKIVATIINKTKILDYYTEKLVENFKNEEIKAAYNKIKLMDPKASLIHKAKTFKEFMSDVFDAKIADSASESKKLTSEAKEISEEAAKYAKKGLKSASFNEIKTKALTVALATPFARNKIIAGIGALVTGLAGAIIGLKLQKASARAGRFVAKQELEKDPSNFIGYTKEELDSKKIDENSLKKESVIKTYLNFLPTVFKDYFAYKKYVKKDLKTEKELQDTLVKVNVSDEQLKDAKNLQRKLFNTFEKVDDKSQDYSESVESATEIAQPFLYYGAFLTMLSPAIVLGIQTLRGKVNPTVVVQKTISVLSKASKFLKSKFFKGNLEQVAKNVSDKVAEIKLTDKPLKKFMEGISFVDIFNKAKNMDFEGIQEILLKKVDSMTIADFQAAVKKLQELPFIEGNEMLENLSKIAEHRLRNKEELIEGINSIFDDLIQGKKEILVPLKENLKEAGIDSKIIQGALKEVKNVSKDFIPSFNDIFGRFKNEIKDMSEEELKKFLAGKENFLPIRGIDFSELNKTKILDTLNNVEKIFNNIPKEELKSIFNKFLEELGKNPDEVIELVKTGQIASILVTPRFEKTMITLGVSWVALNMAVTGLIGAWFSEMQLKAGRLGVMKALDSLQDPTYYANIEQDKKVTNNKTASEPTNLFAAIKNQKK